MEVPQYILVIKIGFHYGSQKIPRAPNPHAHRLLLIRLYWRTYIGSSGEDTPRQVLDRELAIGIILDEGPTQSGLHGGGLAGYSERRESKNCNVQL